MANFNVQALGRPVSDEVWRDLRQRDRAGEFGAPQRGPVVVLVAIAGVFVMAFSLIAGLFTVVARGFASSGAPWMFSLAPVLMLVVFLGVVAVGVGRMMRRRRDWAPFALFARDNGLHFRRCSAGPTYPGLLFGLGDSRRAVNHVYSTQGRLADAGTYQYTTGSGDNSTTHTWQYAAFRLPRQLPHLVLDSKSNDPAFGSNLPVSFARQQQVSLGDPFDQYYTAYAPDGYGPDAFRLFPPDLLAMLIEVPQIYDVEIVDAWLFLYARSVNLNDPSVWQLLGYVDDTIASRLERVAARYTDDRVQFSAPGYRPPTGAFGPGTPMPPVAPQGRRLRQRWAWGGFALVAVAGVVQLLIWYLTR